MTLADEKIGKFASWSCLACISIVLAGCSPKLPTADELSAFHQAGQRPPSVEMDKLVKARTPSSSYRLVPGDLVQIRVPFLVSQSSEASESLGTLARRLDKEGKVVLPMVEEVALGGKTLTEAEEAIVAAYHPQFVVKKPAVVVRVEAFDLRYVDVTGGVASPGRYQLRSDELTLVSLLTRAGNILPQGASVVRINKPGGETKSIVVPIKGLNIPFTDVALEGGETVEIERLNQMTFTVLGLVLRPGTYPYPGDMKINLVQALGSAGGTDPIADPRFATIYRQTADGCVVSARFQLNGNQSAIAKHSIFTDPTLGSPAFAMLKPGDVIEVEKDTRTRTRSFLAQVLYLRAGATAVAATEATYYRDYSSPGDDRRDIP